MTTESERLLSTPGLLALDTRVRPEGNGVYTLDDTVRLIKQVGPTRPGVEVEYSLDPSTVVLKLSDRLPESEVAPVLARALAEATAALDRPAGDEPVFGPAGRDDDRVFSPAGRPEVDAVQRPADAGLRAELRQRGQRVGQAKKIRALALTMGVADGQPNAELLRTLLTADERAILAAADPSSRPLDERVDQQGYLARALGGSGVSSAVIGTAAAVFTGNPLTGLGITVPTVVNAAVGSFTERRLDRERAVGRKPAYNAERVQRDHDHPGLRALLDGASDAPPPREKMPMATAWRNYLRRHAVPTLATAAVAGLLTPLGVPALSTAMVIASSALAKSLADRLVDKKKLEFRLRRIDATERLRLSDPALYTNQLATELAALQTRFARAVNALAPTPAPPDVPGSPPFTVSLAAQLIENVSGTARRALLGGRTADSGPLQTALSAAGPGLLGAITGAMGDKYFLNRDEPARDASKQWSRTHQEAAQAAALAETVEPRLKAFRDLADHLEQLAGLPTEATALPQATTPPTTPRPAARAPLSAYAVQAAAGSLGAVAGAFGLDQLIDIPTQALVLTTAGAAGSLTATPTARYLFRRRELGVHEALETNKAVRSINQSELLEARAITRYLMTRLTLQAESALSQPPPTIQTAATQALRALAAEPPGKPLLAERLIALEHLTHTANALDHHTHHGTPDSQAHLQARLTQALEKAHQLWRDAGVPIVLPLSPALDDDLEHLRRLLATSHSAAPTKQTQAPRATRPKPERGLAPGGD
ncbi:hypothetical protein [Kribbella sp. NPDC004536]|uniref:hypothetical protein n=1 Tax=Kribbella sp. NPDC004536 TaxID=3364106 RepID=UPI0036AAD344